MRRDELPPAPAFRTVAVTPLVTIGRFRADPRHPLFASSGPARWTSFVFPRRAVRIVRSSRERIVATPDVAMFYNAGEDYRREAIDPAGDHCDFFVLHPALLIPILEVATRADLLDTARPFRHSHLRSDPRCYLAQRCLTNYLERAPGADGLMVEEAAMQLLERLVASGQAPARGTGQEAAGARRRALAQRTEEYLAGRFRESATLSELARALDTSPAHLGRAFRAETGRTLHRFRHELRLRAALDLVIEPSVDLTEVALELGFASHSHFSWAFRRQFALSPSQFRAQRSSRRRRDAIDALEARPGSGSPRDRRHLPSRARIRA